MSARRRRVARRRRNEGDELDALRHVLGQRPQISMPLVAYISLTKVTPTSTSPLASIVIAALPLCASLSFGFTASAMPSCCSVSLKLTAAAAPLAALGIEIDFAPSSSRFTASAVEMSVLRSCGGRAMPTATLASGVSLPGTTWRRGDDALDRRLHDRHVEGVAAHHPLLGPAARAEGHHDRVAGRLLEGRDELLERRPDAARRDQGDLRRAGRGHGRDEHCRGCHQKTCPQIAHNRSPRLSLRGAERRSNLVPAGFHCLREIASLRSQ